MLRRMLEQVMDAEVSALCGAEAGERSEERMNHRNGYRERDFETRMGTVDLAIPRVRQGSYFPSFLEPRRRWEKAFVNVVSEAYVLGVSTRKVEDLVEAMGARGMSKSTVSRMSEDLDAQVREFRERRLEKACPYLWLDALYVKVREGSRVVSHAVLVAYAVTEEGEREIVGVEVAAGEMESCWRSFLAGLIGRGLRGVRLVISDAHTGLKAAIRAVLNGTSWQRCTVHFARNVCAFLPKSAQGVVGAALSNVFKQPSRPEATDAMSKVLTLLERYPKAADVARLAEDDVLAFMSFPEKHWRQLHSTNPLERQNREIRRRTDVIGIFPTDDSVLRLVGMLLIEQNDAWAVGRRYFSQESMANLDNSSPLALKEAA
jgi:transposase-like protein